MILNDKAQFRSHVICYIVAGYYGDALAPHKGDCKPCQCYPPGTQETGFGPPLCDQLTGQCQCKTHVYGKNCDQCEDGYYNIASGEVSINFHFDVTIIGLILKALAKF